MKEPKFKVGDRVKVYSALFEPFKGVVKNILSDGIYKIEVNDCIFRSHEKQLRRLVKKKKPEFKIGDRVTHFTDKNNYGTVKRIEPDGCFYVVYDRGAPSRSPGVNLLYAPQEFKVGEIVKLQGESDNLYQIIKEPKPPYAITIKRIDGYEDIAWAASPSSLIKTDLPIHKFLIGQKVIKSYHSSFYPGEIFLIDSILTGKDNYIVAYKLKPLVTVMLGNKVIEDHTHTACEDKMELLVEEPKIISHSTSDVEERVKKLEDQVKNLNGKLDNPSWFPAL